MAYNRSQITARAWVIFRETYGYPRPGFSFRSIGWPCFGWALRKAWAEARAAAARPVITEAAKAERVASLRNELFGLDMQDANLFTANARALSVQAELRALSH